MSSSDPAYLTADHDLDGQARDTPPRRSVVVCATPGMHLEALTDALRRCAAGVPLEYFDGATVTTALARRWRVITVEEYISALHHHRTTIEGVFGVVLQWSHVRRLHQQVSGPAQMSAARTTALLATITPNAQFVVPAHGDADVLAVRAALATRGDAATPLDVAEQLTRIAATERSWRQWIAAADIAPVELAVDGTPTLDQIARDLDLTAPDGDRTVTDPPLSQAEQDLMARFNADVASGALDIETFPDAASDLEVEHA